MKLKDMDKNTDIAGMKVVIPDYKKHDLPKRTMYIKSGWNKGLWLKTDNKQDGRIYPYTFDSFKDIENLEIKEAL